MGQNAALSVAAGSGVYAPQQDSHLLLAAMGQQLPGLAGRHVVDLCTGSGLLAIAAAHQGAAAVTAIDVSPAAARCAMDNARTAGVTVDVRLGTLPTAVACGPFDVVLCNPPYVPAYARASSPAARAWDAGPDGRAFLDPLCTAMPTLLAPGGTALIVQSEVADVAATAYHLRRQGLAVDVVARQQIPFGPVMLARAQWLETRGLIRRGCRVDNLAVIRAHRRPSAPRIRTQARTC